MPPAGQRGSELHLFFESAFRLSETLTLFTIQLLIIYIINLHCTGFLQKKFGGETCFQGRFSVPVGDRVRWRGGT